MGKQMNRALKTALTVTVIFLVSLAEYGVVTAVIDDLSHIKFWVATFFDSASMTFPFICLGVYSHLSFQLVEIIGSMPFLLMIFFSTTFSPGSGVEIVKELRYLFSRFFFWWCNSLYPSSTSRQNQKCQSSASPCRMKNFISFKLPCTVKKLSNVSII